MRTLLGIRRAILAATLSTTVKMSEFMTVLRRDGDRWRIARNMFVARP